MKKIGKLLALLMAVIMCFGMVAMPVYAEEQTETTNEESELTGYCLVTVAFKDFKTDETDNILIEFVQKDTKEKKQVTLTKAEKWINTVYLAPGKHEISFVYADNNREVEIKEEVLTVADAKSAAVELTVTKVVNNNFFPKFFRNNTFTLILLVVSSIAYFILKKRRELLQGK